ncbi:MAG: hypothetical protein H7Y38_14060 [Armatimonadetes bacterium]|nr:hypothetical protein [Armatimonadota bacterium]
MTENTNREVSYDEIETVLKAGAFPHTETEWLHVPVSRLPHDAQDRLVAVCERLLESREYGMVDDNRISVVKLLVALLPKSHGLIRRWMFSPGDIYPREVQFTLCCFLSDVLRFTPRDENVVVTILNLSEEYLDTVTTDEAHNAFMAADMLGDHWEGDAGIKALRRIAEQSENPIGREAATNALKEAARIAP